MLRRRRPDKHIPSRAMRHPMLRCAAPQLRPRWARCSTGTPSQSCRACAVSPCVESCAAPAHVYVWLLSRLASGIARTHVMGFPAALPGTPTPLARAGGALHAIVPYLLSSAPGLRGPALSSWVFSTPSYCEQHCEPGTPAPHSTLIGNWAHTARVLTPCFDGKGDFPCETVLCKLQ